MADTLDMEEVIDRIAEYEGWEQDGPWLSKRFEFDGFGDAIEFVNDVAEIAEELNHHPDIVVQNYNQVVLSITTHDAGGITEKDFAFVDEVEGLSG
ncbi:MAG: 4a-hydroxytetrahydrobiopterin dehydratase [Candidatus Nanohaloarchaea archaeon]|nr:4a-hydroxytetrahydrobiopterin dehydratase [Candidatus Nanohaloarchaea archaeon]